MLASIPARYTIISFSLDPFAKGSSYHYHFILSFIYHSNALHRRELEINNRTYRENLEKMVAGRTVSQKNSMEKLRITLDGVIHTVALTVEMRDPYTAGHQKSVAALATAIAKKLSLSETICEGIRMGGFVHDLGKISIPAEILS